MKKYFHLLLMCIIMVLLVSCGEAPDTQDDAVSNGDSGKQVTVAESEHTPVAIKQSPDKYTWYIKDYVGKNCAALGYTSMGGDRIDKYGNAYVELIFVTEDGSHIDIQDENNLKGYVVTGQNIPPNSEMKLIYEKDDAGEEYSTLVESQSYEEIVLSVKKLNSASKNNISLTEIKPSPDKYTWYIADYVGRNLADFGYTSMGGDRRAKYGASSIKLVLIPDDGSYVEFDDEEILKDYVVTNQSIAPNTELKLVFSKDSNGVEYSSLIESQNIDAIELYIKKIPQE